MKQYKITFHYKDRTIFIKDVDFYREFETEKEAKEWAEYWLNESAFYITYTYKEIPLTEYIDNI